MSTPTVPAGRAVAGRSRPRGLRAHAPPALSVPLRALADPRARGLPRAMWPRGRGRRPCPAPPAEAGPGRTRTSGDLSDLGAWFTAHLALHPDGGDRWSRRPDRRSSRWSVWIGSRATFVYIDDVATGRAELSRPWRVHAEKAQSYFAWRFGLAAALLASLGARWWFSRYRPLSSSRAADAAGRRRGDPAPDRARAPVPPRAAGRRPGRDGAAGLRRAARRCSTQAPCGAAVRRLVDLVRAHPAPLHPVCRAQDRVRDDARDRPGDRRRA